MAGAGDNNYWFGSGATGAIFGGYSTSGTTVYYSGNNTSAEMAAAQAQAYAQYKAELDRLVQREYVMRELRNLLQFEDVENGVV